MDLKIKPYQLSLIVFLFNLGCGIYLTELDHKIEAQNQQQLIQQIAVSEATAMERRLNHSLAATYILEQEVLRTDGRFPNFESYAAQILKSIDGITNLQLAPDGIVQRIYPLAGHEKAIGHNILRDDHRRAEAWLAVREHRLTLAGPFELVQGGVAVIGRNPVFLEGDGGRFFWGFVSALINLDDLVAATDLLQLPERGYIYQLSRISPDTKKPEVFAGAETLPSNIEVVGTYPIQVPNATWQLTIANIGPYSHLLGYTLTILISSFITLLVYRFLKQPELLRIQVDHQTKQLQELAYQDQLTGLANRRLLLAQMKQEILDLKRNKTTSALLCLDLDDFKRINDTMGHDAGDTLLKKAAARFRDTLRSNDIIARLGGDEFAILLVDVGHFENVQSIARNLIEVVSKPLNIIGHELVVSASIGIAMIPDDGDDSNVLMRHADLALYAAKNAGKNHFQFFDAEMQQRATQNLAIEQDLRRAIAEHEFVLYYQPQVSMSQKKIIGYEALIRWQHPEKGLVFPDQFIHSAEVTHKIIPIGYWVLRHACEMLAHRAQADLEPVTIAVNLSPRQLSDPDLSNMILKMIAETGADAELLEIEITETALMENMQSAIQSLETLRRAGVRIAIDDFGTGYSSLSQLKRLPLDTLKIDRSFVDGVGHEGQDRQITEAIIAMAKKLDLKIVAEGIETPEQLAFLIDNQADFGQGYLFSRPMPEADMLQQSLNLYDDWPQRLEAAEA